MGDGTPSSVSRSPLGFLLAGAIIVGIVAIAFASRDVAAPVVVADSEYVQSDTCVRCHPGHFASWHRTFHRTMTQAASPQSIVGDFNAASYTYDGVTSRFFRKGDDYMVETLDQDGTIKAFKVDRTVGSRRIQQYVTRLGDRYIRLPLAWNITEQRWFHLNGGFLDPDDTDFNKHLAVWDANCIFCHNTKPKPGYDVDRQTFASSVKQLGISCEACHGPASEHIARNANPARRYFLYATGKSDPTIVNPAKLPPDRQLQICGHCHGQRTPEPLARIRDFMVNGDPFTPGDDLGQYTKPIWRDSHLEGVDLSLRFWKDGTPRLTAYEYQGLLMTRDYREGGLTCLNCHNAHGGDPKGMIDEDKRGAAACLACHAAIGEDIPSHTKHAASSSGSRCYACHMPKIAYGILEVHPTHRIQKPDPSRAWTFDMPEACTLCHTNQTALWAAESVARSYGVSYGAAPPPDRISVAENVRAMLAGDVVQRAVAVMAMGDDASYASDPRERLWAVPFLLLEMDDSYGAIRHFAYRSLVRLVERAGQQHREISDSVAHIPKFDPQATKTVRADVISVWQAWWRSLDKSHIPHPGSAVPLGPDLQPDSVVVERLMAARDNRSISIGE